ncbi:MAG: hypothetical protein IT384_24440 [Deltaproteobacteria bacterium]|nr:hypothetical protein [Deltaproteobacteria bacterium]
MQRELKLVPELTNQLWLLIADQLVEGAEAERDRRIQTGEDVWSAVSRSIRRLELFHGCVLSGAEYDALYQRLPEAWRTDPISPTACRIAQALRSAAAVEAIDLGPDRRRFEEMVRTREGVINAVRLGQRMTALVSQQEDFEERTRVSRPPFAPAAEEAGSPEAPISTPAFVLPREPSPRQRTVIARPPQ